MSKSITFPVSKDEHAGTFSRVCLLIAKRLPVLRFFGRVIIVGGAFDNRSGRVLMWFAPSRGERGQLGTTRDERALQVTRLTAHSIVT